MKKNLLSQGDFNLKRWGRQRPGGSNAESTPASAIAVVKVDDSYGSSSPNKSFQAAL